MKKKECFLVFGIISIFALSSCDSYDYKHVSCFGEVGSRIFFSVSVNSKYKINSDLDILLNFGSERIYQDEENILYSVFHSNDQKSFEKIYDLPENFLLSSNYDVWNINKVEYETDKYSTTFDCLYDGYKYVVSKDDLATFLPQSLTDVLVTTFILAPTDTIDFNDFASKFCYLNIKYNFDGDKYIF